MQPDIEILRTLHKKTIGVDDENNLNFIFKEFINVISRQFDDKTLTRKNCSELVEVVKPFIFHMHLKHITMEVLDHRRYYDYMAGIVSCFIDLQLKLQKLSKTSDDSKNKSPTSFKKQTETKSELISSISALLSTIFGNSKIHVLDTLLQLQSQSATKRRYLSQILMRMCADKLYTSTPEKYMKMMIFLKIMLKKCPQRQKNALKNVSSRLNVPSGLTDWLKRMKQKRLAKFLTSQSSKSTNKIVLSKKFTFRQCRKLLDRLCKYRVESDESEEKVNGNEDGSQPLFFVDRRTDTEGGGSQQLLFFVDKGKGGGENEEELAMEVDPYGDLAKLVENMEEMEEVKSENEDKLVESDEKDEFDEEESDSDEKGSKNEKNQSKNGEKDLENEEISESDEEESDADEKQAKNEKNQSINDETQRENEEISESDEEELDVDEKQAKNEKSLSINVEKHLESEEISESDEEESDFDEKQAKNKKMQPKNEKNQSINDEKHRENEEISESDEEESDFDEKQPKNAKNQSINDEKQRESEEISESDEEESDFDEKQPKNEKKHFENDKISESDERESKNVEKYWENEEICESDEEELINEVISEADEDELKIEAIKSRAKSVEILHSHDETLESESDSVENESLDSSSEIEVIKSIPVVENVEKSTPHKKNVGKSTPLKKNVEKSILVEDSVETSTPVKKNVEKLTPFKKNVEKSITVVKNVEKSITDEKNVKKSNRFQKKVEKSIPVVKNVEKSITNEKNVKESTPVKKTVEKSITVVKNVEKSITDEKNVKKSNRFQKKVEKSIPVVKNVEKSITDEKNVKESTPVKKNVKESTPVKKNVEESILAKKNIEKSISGEENLEKSIPTGKKAKSSPKKQITCDNTSFQKLPQATSTPFSTLFNLNLSGDSQSSLSSSPRVTLTDIRKQLNDESSLHLRLSFSDSDEPMSKTAEISAEKSHVSQRDRSPSSKNSPAQKKRAGSRELKSLNKNAILLRKDPSERIKRSCSSSLSSNRKELSFSSAGAPKIKKRRIGKSVSAIASPLSDVSEKHHVITEIDDVLKNKGSGKLRIRILRSLDEFFRIEHTNCNEIDICKPMSNPADLTETLRVVRIALKDEVGGCANNMEKRPDSLNLLKSLDVCQADLVSSTKKRSKLIRSSKIPVLKSRKVERVVGKSDSGKRSIPERKVYYLRDRSRKHEV